MNLKPDFVFLEESVILKKKLRRHWLRARDHPNWNMKMNIKAVLHIVTSISFVRDERGTMRNAK